MWLAFALITALCCIDYMYFTEGWGAILMNDRQRKVAHVFILLAIVLVGYWGWFRHPMQWLKKVWVWSHMLSLALLITIGISCYLFGYMDKALLKKIGDLRLFFCSPVPYFMLYILSRITLSLQAVTSK